MYKIRLIGDSILRKKTTEVTKFDAKLKKIINTMPPEKSGYYYPNKFARITIEAMEEIMGTNGLNAILNLA